MKTNLEQGFSLLELLVVSVLIGIVLTSTIEISARAFDAKLKLDKNISSKQIKVNINERILSKIKEASTVYKTPQYITIPVNGSSATVSAEYKTLAVLNPKFDSNGNIIQPSTNVTTFKGVAFSILPAYQWDGSHNYVLVETETEFNLAVNANDPLKITQTLPTDWRLGKTYLVAKNLKSATTTNLKTITFDAEGDLVTFAFIPKDGYIYFPSQYGMEVIDDGGYLTGCSFRNYRIN